MTYEQIKEKYVSGETLTRKEIDILMHGETPKEQIKGTPGPMSIWENESHLMYNDMLVVMFERN